MCSQIIQSKNIKKESIQDNLKLLNNSINKGEKVILKLKQYAII